MKKTTLAAKDGELLEKLIAQYGKVVTANQIEEAASSTWDYQQTHNRVQKLVKNGWLIRIKRGLYVISDLSSRGFLSVSPYAIANLLVEDSFVSFEAALAYRGMFDQYVSQFTSLSLKQYQLTDLDAIQYRFIKAQEKMFIGWELVTIENLTAKVAFAEKALVDMIYFRKGKYVVDLVIEKLLNYSDELDKQRIIHYSGLASQKTIKVFGLIFDFMGWESGQLTESLSKTKSTHFMSSGDKQFNAKWRLYYDEHFDKYNQAEGK